MDENEEVLVEEGGELEGFSEVDDNGDVVVEEAEVIDDPLIIEEEEDENREPTEEEEFMDEFRTAQSEYSDGSEY